MSCCVVDGRRVYGATRAQLETQYSGPTQNPLLGPNSKSTTRAQLSRPGERKAFRYFLFLADTVKQKRRQQRGQSFVVFVGYSSVKDQNAVLIFGFWWWQQCGGRLCRVDRGATWATACCHAQVSSRRAAAMAGAASQPCCKQAGVVVLQVSN